MLFNSFEFIFIFLPITVFLYYLFAKYRLVTLSKLTLITASVFFYGYWDYRYLVLLFVSIVANYFLGKLLIKRPHKVFLVFGLAFNLALLGYFKYADFFISSVNYLTNFHLQLLQVVLPLGISFITFQKIGFLVDCYRGITKKYAFFDYILFVVFFPQLISGPIVHHKEIIPQFEKVKSFILNYKNLALGCFFFSMGLFKKVIIADSLAMWVKPAFDTASSLTFFEAWGTALSYSLQLYFDFSGYSEMALGLGLFFNIRLPINFLSPYKADSIIDFWRRWHITLSTFLRNYLYFALGGNRKGRVRRYVNLFLTMLLGGFWHGAGWTFVVWGALHGFYLILNHGYRGIKESLGITKTFTNKSIGGLESLFGRILTFGLVVIAWVFFRAHSFQDAFKVLKGMFMYNGIQYSKMPYFYGFKELWVLGGLLLIVNFAPNTFELSNRFKPNNFWLIIVGILFIGSMLFINRVSEFIYFQF